MPGAFDRPLYSTSVAAELADLNPRTLVAYESMGLIESAGTGSDQQRFSGRTIRRIKVIRELTHELGVNLSAVALTLDLFDRLLEAGATPSASAQHAFEEYRHSQADEQAS